MSLIFGIADDGVPVRPIDELFALQPQKSIEKLQSNDTKQKDKKRKRVKDYFKTIARATETANKQLKDRGSLYRFCVFKKDEKVFIEIVGLQGSMKNKTLLIKDITNDDFKQWIDDIAHIEGLIIDKKG